MAAVGGDVLPGQIHGDAVNRLVALRTCSKSVRGRESANSGGLPRCKPSPGHKARLHGLALAHELGGDDARHGRSDGQAVVHAHLHFALLQLRHVTRV